MTATVFKYRILSQISSHSDSKVWLAEHISLNVKRIIKGIRKASPYYDILVKEAALLKNLKNPHIPEIYDLEEDDEYTYIVEEYIAGESLKALLCKRALSEKEIFDLIIQLGKILDYLHSFPERILYLDLKPENIIVSDNGYYLVDFGSAHLEGGCGPHFGTRSFASPEQMTGDRLTETSDIYSMGKMLEYLIDHSNISPNIEKALRNLVSRCSDKRKWERICSIKSFLAHIGKLYDKQSRFSDKPLKISFAGAACNTGVTYLSILLAAYINGLGRKCIWAEANDTEAWYSLSEKIGNFRALAGLETISRKTYENSNYTETDIIADHGVLREEMPEDFYESDVTLIVTGNRIWETEEIMRSRALSLRCKKTVYIINPALSAEYETVKAIGPNRYITVPFIADFDTILRNEEVKAVFHELSVLTGIICT